MKPYLPAKFEVSGCYGYCVLLLQSDYEEEEHMVTFTLKVVDETETENWNFLMYGRIEHPMQSPYTRYYRTL